MHDRPISPHLSVYRWQITNTLSILHRLTGVALVVGVMLLVAWLYSAAYRADLYFKLHECLTSPVGMALMLGWTLAFYYHLANGIRHLFWDIGKGFELKQVYASGWTVLFFTLAATGLSWGFVVQGLQGLQALPGLDGIL